MPEVATADRVSTSVKDYKSPCENRPYVFRILVGKEYPIWGFSWPSSLSPWQRKRHEWFPLHSIVRCYPGTFICQIVLSVDITSLRNYGNYICITCSKPSAVWEIQVSALCVRFNEFMYRYHKNCKKIKNKNKLWTSIVHEAELIIRFLMFRWPSILE